MKRPARLQRLHKALQGISGANIIIGVAALLALLATITGALS